MADPALKRSNGKAGEKKGGGAGAAMSGMGGGKETMGFSNIGPELMMGMASLFAHKLRSLLTMLGMIFGVGAVVAMLSITAGAQKEMMSFIDQLGVNNIIVEAKEAVDRNELQTGSGSVAGRPQLPRFPCHFGERSGTRGDHAAQALQAAKAAAENQPGAAAVDRRVPPTSWRSTA